MANTSKPHRNRQIFLAAAATVLALFGLRYWYGSWAELDYRAQPIEASQDLQSYLDDQQGRLTSGAMPIDRAMQQLAQRGRAGQPLITPTPSADPAPAAGWMHHPDYEPPPPPPEPEPEPEPEVLEGAGALDEDGAEGATGGPVGGPGAAVPAAAAQGAPAAP